MCGYLLGIRRNAKFRERHNQKMRPTHLYPILIHPNVSYLPPPHPSMVISVISMVISVGISVISVIPVTRHLVTWIPHTETISTPSSWIEYKVDRAALGDRQRHQVCMLYPWKQGYTNTCTYPVSILRKSISGRHRPVRVADGPMTARCRFT